MIEETKPTGWDRAAMLGRWLRDKFAILFVTSWLYMLGWTIVIGAFAVLLYLDGKFSYQLAVGSSIAPVAFMAMGFVFRFFAAVFLMASERSRMLAKAERDDWPEEKTKLFKRRKRQDWEKKGKVWRRIGLSISVLVCLHAIGIGLEALSHKRDSAKIEREVQDNLQENVDAQLALLDGQKDDIRSDLAISTAPLIARAEKLDSDGKLNEERTDAIQARIDKLTDDAQAKINEIDAKKLALIAPDTDEAALEDATAKAEASEASGWAPLFIGIAQFVTMSQDPSEWIIYLCAVAFIVFWVLNAEGIVIFVPKELMKMHMQDAIAARKEAEKRARSEAARKGHDTRKQAEEDEQNQLQIADAGFWSLKIIKALNNNMPKRTVKGTMRTFFSNMEPDAVRVRLQRLMDARLELPKGFYQDAKGDVKRADRAIERGFLAEDHKTYLMQDHIDYILMEGEYAPKKKAPKEEPKPKQEVNGTDHSTDLTIPELGQDDEPNRPPA